MTGPEHYRAAEQQLIWAGENLPEDYQLGRDNLLTAQVHATLALAAATALSYGLPAPDWQAWYKAAATPQEVTA